MKFAIQVVLFSFILAWADFGYADPIHDCTSGCTVITCSDGWCTVYECNEDGCVEVGGYPYYSSIKSAQDQKPTKNDSTSRNPVLPDGMNCHQNRCAVKTCNKQSCTVYGFEKGSITPLATVANTKSTLNEVVNEYLAGDATQ